MNFLQNLYLGERIAPKANRIIEKLNKNEIVPGVYVLALASNPENMLDLIPAWEITQKGYPKEKLMVIGLASDKKEAIQLSQFLIQEAMEFSGNPDVRTFLRTKWEGQIWN